MSEEIEKLRKQIQKLEEEKAFLEGRIFELERRINPFITLPTNPVMPFIPNVPTLPDGQPWSTMQTQGSNVGIARHAELMP